MAVKPKDEPLAGLLRQTLAQQNAGEACPDAETVAAYYDRTLDPGQGARCEAHFADCARCREQLALLARSDESREPTREHHWVWDWRWLAATGALLTVITYWGLQRPAHLATQTPSAPNVAMTQPPQQPPPLAQRQQAPLLQAPAASPGAPKAKDVARRAAPRAAPVVPAVPNTLAEENAPVKDLPLNGRNYSELKLNPPTANAPASAANAVSADSAKTRPNETKQLAARDGGTAATAAKPQAAISAEAAPQTAPFAPAPEARAKAELAAPAAVQTEQNAAAPAAPVRAYGALHGDNLQKKTAVGPFLLVKTPDAATIWRVENGSTVEISHDAGSSWQPETVPATGEILAGSAPTAKVLWLAGRAGAVLLTSDGGATWKMVMPPAKTDLVAISAVSATDATVTTPNGRRLVTADGGKSWTPVL